MGNGVIDVAWRDDKKNDQQAQVKCDGRPTNPGWQHLRLEQCAPDSRLAQKGKYYVDDDERRGRYAHRFGRRQQDGSEEIGTGTQPRQYTAVGILKCRLKQHKSERGKDDCRQDGSTFPHEERRAVGRRLWGAPPWTPFRLLNRYRPSARGRIAATSKAPVTLSSVQNAWFVFMILSSLLSCLISLVMVLWPQQGHTDGGRHDEGDGRCPDPNQPPGETQSAPANRRPAQRGRQQAGTQDAPSD